MKERLFHLSLIRPRRKKKKKMYEHLRRFDLICIFTTYNTNQMHGLKKITLFKEAVGIIVPLVATVLEHTE